ncbi:MAG: hypothetical protein WBL25_02095 [Anaerolineales bacterium]
MQIPPDLISAGISFIVTILILSYLIGDNPLFRATVYVFVGVAAGYVAAVAMNEIILPLLIQPIASGVVFANPGLAASLVVPLLGSVLLLFKVSPRLSHLGQLSMAYLVGVGAAVTIGGAVLGTLLPQITATFDNFDISRAVERNTNAAFMIVNGAAVLVGVIGTLVYFHFGASQKSDGSVGRNVLVNIASWVGRVYIAVTFGVLFAGVYMAALTALIERMDSMHTFILQLMQSF